MVRLSKLRRRLMPGSIVVKFFVGLICLGLVLLILQLTNTTHFFSTGTPSNKKVVTVGRPVSPPKQVTTIQPPKGSTTNSSSVDAARNSGGATDTGGTATVTTGSSQWTTSASGLITVKQPVANAKFQDGSVLSGSAKIGAISYRISDNTVGVVAEGTLSVANGNFSGNLHFSPRGTGGRLDVFSTDSKGIEYNEVQINVSF